MISSVSFQGPLQSLLAPQSAAAIPRSDLPAGAVETREARRDTAEISPEARALLTREQSS